MKANKVVISDELKARLTAARDNGSVVASDILAELKRGNPKEIFSGHANYFSSKRKVVSLTNYKKLSIMITYCSKNLSNPAFPGYGDPMAPNRSENRGSCSPSSFVGMFRNLRHYSSEELAFFTNALCCATKIRFKLESSMEAIEAAYNEVNYNSFAQNGETTLHSSCMRYADMAAIAADFYHNFAGAKIMVAYETDGSIVGRAIVWDKVNVTYQNLNKSGLMVIDRVYYTFDFIRLLMLEKARTLGIHLRKRHNTYYNHEQFTVLNPIDFGEIRFDTDDNIDAKASVCVPKVKWHKKGSPYLDTFCYLEINKNQQMTLSNYNSSETILSLQSAEGRPCKQKSYCPVCGKVHSNTPNYFCYECQEKLMKDTPFGKLFASSLRPYGDKVVPSVLLTRRGKPTPSFAIHEQINRLFD